MTKRLLIAKSKVRTYSSGSTITKIMFTVASTYEALSTVMSLYHKWILAKTQTTAVARMWKCSMWTKPCKEIGKELHEGTPLFRENQSLRETQCMITVPLVGKGKNKNYLPFPLLNFFFLSPVMQMLWPFKGLLSPFIICIGINWVPPPCHLTWYCFATPM